MSADPTQPDGRPTAPVAGPARGSRHRLVAGVVLLVLVWAVVMLFRWELRAQWWAYQLARSDTPDQRAFYMTRLASIGNKSLNVLPRLVASDDAEIREAAICVLKYCSGARADELLIAMLADPDPENAGLAATTFAMKPAAAGMAVELRDKVALNAVPAASWGTVVALGRLPGETADHALLDLTRLGQLPPDVKAQLIDSLGIRGCREALPYMTEAMNDDRPIDKLPFSLVSARRAIGALQADLAAKGADPAAAMSGLGEARTVSEVAARWVRMLGGSPPPLTTTQAASQPAGP